MYMYIVRVHLYKHDTCKKLNIKSFYSFILIRARLPPNTYTDCILIGKRYTGQEGQAAGIIHEVLDGDKLMERAIELGEEIGRANLDRDTLSQLKNGLNHTALIPISKPHEYYPKL